MAIGRYHVRRLGLHGEKPGWRRGKSLDNFRQRSPQIQEALFLDDSSGRRLDMADLKSFVTTDEDGTVSGRYNDARLTRNQFRALASNDTGDEPKGVLPADTTLDPEAFVQLLGPLFADAHKKGHTCSSEKMHYIRVHRLRPCISACPLNARMP